MMSNLNVFEMLGTVNLADVKAASDFEAAPAGVYLVELTDDGSEVYVNDDDKPIAKCVFKIVSDVDGNEEYSGRKVFHNFTLTSEPGKSGVSALSFFKSFLLKAEIIEDENEGINLGNPEFWDALFGDGITIATRIGVDGKYNRIKSFLSTDELED